MNLTSSELAELIREIEIEDPIDYGDLTYDEDELRRLVCSHICEEIAEQAGQFGEENRQVIQLAVAAKLVLENLVLNVRLMQTHGEAPAEIGTALFRRLRGRQAGD